MYQADWQGSAGFIFYQPPEPIVMNRSMNQTKFYNSMLLLIKLDD